MKNQIIAMMMVVVTVSCGQVSDKNKNEKTEEVQQVVTYQIDTSRSELSWQRIVENKVENKQIQIFGQTATVNIENAVFTSSGTFPVLSGKIVYRNEVLSEMELLADFTMMRLFSISSDQLIDVEMFPPSLLKIDKIVPDSIADQYIMTGELTIKEKTNPVKATAVVKNPQKEIVSVNAVLELQTLDWPVREEVNPANVKKDIVILTLQLTFSNPTNSTDTILLKTR